MIVGIDISKLKFDATVLLEKDKQRHKIFPNTLEGFKELEDWLGGSKAHMCLESTGRYGEKLCLFLHQKGYKLSVVNPSRIKAYAQSEGCRTKADKADSATIARFCRAQCPGPWSPPSLEEQQLRDLYRCRQALLEDKTKLSNRMECLEKEKSSAKIWKDSLSFVEEKIKEVDQHIKGLLESHQNLGTQVDLLKTIPGISEKTAVAILSELPSITSFDKAKEVAAFAGLTPFLRQSGTSLQGKGRLSKVGNANLRKALYMPVLSAKRYNPLVKEFCNRLAKKGKAPMVIIGAAMRKLLHIIFGVLKHQKSFYISEKTS